jgi:hypothetical protein
MINYHNIDSLLISLRKTKFRGSFHLNEKMKSFVRDKGIDKVRSDAYDIITKRLGSANPINDGKQTPMKQTHPVFIAQHATGTCCRGCLKRIHHINKGKELTKEEINYIIEVITRWIIEEVHL